MKLDKHFTNVLVCPVTQEFLTSDEHYFNDGVCPKCGHKQDYHSHAKNRVGKWLRPSPVETFFFGKKKEFIPKSSM